MKKGTWLVKFVEEKGAYKADPLGNGPILLHGLAKLGLDAEALLGRPR
jgi:hypothetical protein